MASAPVADQTAPAGPATAAEFEAFDSFPWSKHQVFLLGLIETLGGPAALRPNPTHEGSAAFCRTVFFRRQTGRRVDFSRYNSFRADHPEYPSIDRRLLSALYAASASIEGELGLGDLSLGGSSKTSSTSGQESLTSPNPLASPSTNRNRRLAEAVAAGPVINPFDGTPTPPVDEETSNGSGVDIPSWQRSAPRNTLKVDRVATPTGTGGGGAGAGEAPYSDKFAKVVEAIQTGKELEGIKQIPDTIIRQPGISPMGKLKAPRKPWETAASASPLASGLSFIDGALTPSDGEQGQQEQKLGLGGGQPLVDLEFPEPPPSPPAEGEIPTEADGGSNPVAN
ncbi:hypothetical protein SPBR_03784 [Sporothrix brasiliensis 5110]|uniref:Uncharacterized protein n=1 Tax=Sporothrix brasiliensis 5110 TaxID=1398154 RepID=A0A0C2J0N9_9PEZI|nr:uncharacterized protein SPBR_03784 [Sporothrix brasiliensis 5110]KIH94956.1 hypothetical protein SPBR_03784 [Sporothrix brasiliensis 5110]